MPDHIENIKVADALAAFSKNIKGGGILDEEFWSAVGINKQIGLLYGAAYEENQKRMRKLAIKWLAYASQTLSAQCVFANMSGYVNGGQEDSHQWYESLTINIEAILEDVQP